MRCAAQEEKKGRELTAGENGIGRGREETFISRLAEGLARQAGRLPGGDVGRAEQPTSAGGG